ncbi:MAG: sugar ABC transporter permease [Anaerolineae bacterium]|nr:sugar ABC transporter permease [Anaerolineae bacterium]NUQ04100.1 sugar ABC transporter permease [Anaerolineae bacterium]
MQDTALTASKAVSLPWSRRLLRMAFPYLLIAPTLILVFIFTLYPAANAVIDSLYSIPRSAREAPVFVGLGNYADLFTPDHFIGATFTLVIGNTLFFAVTSVLFSVPLSLGFALLLNQRMPLLGVWRFGIFYPALLPLIGAASIWAFLFSDTVGLINTVLRSLGGTTVNWLGDPNLVLISVTIVNIWKQAGYYMIFYLAGLQNIPRELYEAAALDGAHGWGMFSSITLPLLRRTSLFVLVVNFIFAFQTVEQLQALGQGNPGDRGTLLLYLIFKTIPERRNWGYVNAMTVILVLLLLTFTIANFFLFERGREDADA